MDLNILHRLIFRHKNYFEDDISATYLTRRISKLLVDIKLLAIDKLLADAKIYSVSKCSVDTKTFVII